MSFLSWLRGSVAGIFWNTSYTTITTGTVTVEQSTAVMSSIKILADSLSRLPVYVRKNGKADKKHPLHKLLYYSPNGWMTAQTFWSTLETNRNLQGNAFALIRRKNGVPFALEILTNDRVTSWETNNKGELFYLIDAGKKVSSMDILHFKHFSMDGVLGLSPVELTRLHWETSGKAGLASKQLYENGMLSTLALKSTIAGGNTKLMQAAQDKFKDNTGAINAGKVVPLPPNTELQSIPINLRDLQFLETIKANASFIAGMFGVPAHMVTGEAPKFSNFEQSMLDFKFNTMANIISVYEYELELKLLGDDERDAGYTIEFDDKALMAADAKSRAEVDKIHFEMGVIDGNTIAVKEGYGEYPGGEKRYIASNNLTPIDKADEQKDENI